MKRTTFILAALATAMLIASSADAALTGQPHGSGAGTAVHSSQSMKFTQPRARKPAHPPPVTPCADVDGNGKVNWTDLFLIARHLHSTNATYDVDRDGRVDLDDLRIAQRQLGKRCAASPAASATPTRSATATRTASATSTASTSRTATATATSTATSSATPTATATATPDTSQAPIIETLSSLAPARGDLVTVTGTGFGDTAIALDGTHVDPQGGGTDAHLAFVVPPHSPVGEVTLSITNAAGADTAVLQIPFNGDALPETDPGASAASVIGPAGGSITAAGMTLTVPPGALIDDVSITMTPLTGIQGSPFSRVLGGASFTPEGLHFLKPATLSIPLPAAISPDEVVSFTYGGSGQALHLVPSSTGAATIEILVSHFSGNAAAAGDLHEIAAAVAYEPSPAQERAEQRIAAALFQFQVEAITDAQRDTEIDAAMTAWYASVRTGFSAATGGELAFFELAIGEWFSWRAFLAEFGREEAFATQLAESRTLALNLAVDFAGRLLAGCTGAGAAPFASLQPLLRFASFVALDPATFDLHSRDARWANGRDIAFTCTDIVIVENFSAPAALANFNQNTFTARARVDFYNGPSRTDIPLVFKVSLLEPLGNVLKASVLSDDGRLSERIAVSTSESSQSYTLDVLFADAEAGDDVLRAWAKIRGLTRPVRSRIVLTASATGTTYEESIASIEVDSWMGLSALVAGDGMSGASVQFSLSGIGSLEAATRTTSASGEASNAYYSPGDQGGPVTVTASVTVAGVTSDDSITFDVVRRFEGEFEGTLSSCYATEEGPRHCDEYPDYRIDVYVSRLLADYGIIGTNCLSTGQRYDLTVADDRQSFTGKYVSCHGSSIPQDILDAMTVSGTLIGDTLTVDFSDTRWLPQWEQTLRFVGERRD